MMTDPSDDISDAQLDQLLQDWSNDNEPSSKEMDRLIESADTTASVATSELPRGRILIAVAATLAFIVIGLSQWRKNSDVTQVASLPVQTFTTQQREQKKELLSELDKMFAGKRVWFAETKSDVILGGDKLHRDEGVARKIASESVVAMRLVLAKRPSPQSPWQPVWSTDVVSRSDQLVQFRTDGSESMAAAFTAWSHVLPDGLVAFDLNLQFHDEASGTISDNLLLTPGDAVAGGSVIVNDVEFQLFHAAELIGAKS